MPTYTAKVANHMNPKRLVFLGSAALLLVFSLVHAQTVNNPVDSTFAKFWSASSPENAEGAIDDILKSGVTFEDALARLKAGRKYTAQKTGIILLNNRTKDGIQHFYHLNVPDSYDPSKRYQVRFQLHGGVGGRETNQPRGTGESPLPGAEQIYVVPYSWDAEPWWSNDQVLNLDTIIDSLKRTYNVDENRIVLSGVSDGGTGAYYIGMRETTPYASFLPLNGFIMVLANETVDDGQVFPNNLRNKPMFVINGGEDPLYPTATVEPFVKHMMTAVKTAYYPQPNAAHNTRWWPEMKDTYEKFVSDHPRDPDPDTLTWETANLDHNRAHWLVIDQFGARPGESVSMSDLNMFQTPRSNRPIQLFQRQKHPGRVDLERQGNTVQATTRGVAAFTLLLSPEKFDFNQPIKVVANGHTVFEGRVERNLKTLLRWAAHDNDRTMLYAAEIKIKL
jgi:poly(3-hydroxybutyrate) depolymerase